MAKYSKGFERDWKFYLKNKDKFNFAGCVIPTVVVSQEGVDAKQAFHRYDSCGKMLPCSKPKLFREILVCKKSINMHIKMWSEGYADCAILEEELLEEFIDPPEWVEKSFQNQVEKALRHSNKGKTMGSSISRTVLSYFPPPVRPRRLFYEVLFPIGTTLDWRMKRDF